VKAKAVRFLVAAGIAGGIMIPTAAVAQNYPNPPSPSVSPQQQQTVSAPATPRPTQSGGTLPFTGGDIAGLAVVGLGAAGVGVILVRAGRRRRAEV
jgi:hypothetical protein